MRRSLIFIILIFIILNLSFAVTVDVKTHLLEKTKLLAIKIGTIYYLEKSGINVSEIGEDYTVWLKNLQVQNNGADYYYYRLTAKISYPSAFAEKKTIVEQEVYFEFGVDNRYNEFNDKDLMNRLEKFFTKISDRIKLEAFVGGKEVAKTVKYLLFRAGANVR